MCRGALGRAGTRTCAAQGRQPEAFIMATARGRGGPFQTDARASGASTGTAPTTGGDTTAASTGGGTTSGGSTTDTTSGSTGVSPSCGDGVIDVGEERGADRSSARVPAVREPCPGSAVVPQHRIRPPLCPWRAPEAMSRGAPGRSLTYEPARRGRMRILEVVDTPDAVARVLHGARAAALATARTTRAPSLAPTTSADGTERFEPRPASPARTATSAEAPRGSSPAPNENHSSSS